MPVHTVLRWIRKSSPRHKLAQVVSPEFGARRQRLFTKDIAWVAALTVLLACGISFFTLYRSTLPLAGTVAVGVFLALVVGLLSWRVAVPLVGPVFFYDLVRSARRKQYVVLRCVYLAVLLGVFFCIYSSYFLGKTLSFQQLFLGGTMRPGELAGFAATFFYSFLLLQFVAAALLTPVFTAGAVSEEKENKTLEYLLATDLRGREIVLGLGASRLANLALVFLTGMPVFGFLQLLGGVDPPLVLAGFAFTGITMVSLTALGLCCSVYASRPRQAILWTYMITGGYLVSSGFGWILFELGWNTFPSTAYVKSPVTLGDIVEAVNFGNPITVVVFLIKELTAGKALDVLLWPALGKYALFQALTTVTILWWAARRLRPVALLGPPEPVKNALPGFRKRYKPAVGRWPLLWKEIFAEPGPGFRRLGRIVVGVLVPVSFLPALSVFYFHFLTRSNFNQWEGLDKDINLWVRIVGTLVALLMFLRVAFQAAASITGEKERGTLDGLLTAPLGSTSIVLAKWAGSMAGPRWMAVWLGLIGFIGLATGGLAVRALPGLLAAWVVYAGLAAGLGLWYSVSCRTTHRANLATLLTAMGFVGGHWIFWIFFLPFLFTWSADQEAGDWWTNFQTFGLTPPVTLFVLAYRAQEEVDTLWVSWDERISLARLGLGIWGMCGLALLGAALVRFQVAFQRFDLPFSGRFLGVVPGQSQGELSAPRKRRRRCVKAFLWSAAMLSPVIALSTWIIRQNAASGDLLTKVMAETDRLDPGWRLEEIEARRKVYADDDNAAVTVLKVSPKLRTWAGSNFWTNELQESLRKVEPNCQLSPEQWEALVLRMEIAEGPLIEARRLADQPEGGYRVTWAADGYSTLLPHLQQPRLLAEFLGCDVLLRAQDEDADGSLLSCRAILNAGRSLADEPLVISQLVRMACRSVALKKIERVLAQGQPSEEALSRMQEALQEDEKNPILVYALRGERALMDRLYKYVHSGGYTQAQLLDLIRSARRSGVAPGRELKEILQLFAGGVVKKSRAASLDVANRALEIVKLPLDEQASKVAEIERSFSDLPPLSQYFSPALQKLFSANQRTMADERCGIAILAAERFRRARGGWPESMQQMVPAFLAEVPKDPFVSNQALRYRRTTEGVVIYSVGLDGKDDGGNVVSNDPAKPATDQGYRLWDVLRRRKPSVDLMGPPEPEGVLKPKGL